MWHGNYSNNTRPIAAVAILESDIQIALMDWLDAQKPNCEWLSIPNEATYKNKRLRKMGVKPGVYDILFWALPLAPLVWVELKKKYGRRTQPQKDFGHICDKRKVPHYTIKSDDPLEVIELVKTMLIEWGAL